MAYLKSLLARTSFQLFALILSVTALNAAPPVITSSLSDTATVDDPYSYTITATESPTTFGATDLPEGLTRSGATISGTPTVAGIYSITIVAENVDGSDIQTLALTVNEAVPVITSANSAAGTVGDPFNYTITADNNPATFSVTGLDAFPGLVFDLATGIISGTPTVAASGDLVVGATNTAGTDTQLVTLTITATGSGVPVITSSLNETVTVGEPYSYSILATNSPTAYAIGGDSLPSGLFRSRNVISGTPTEVGVFKIDISATNSAGSDTETLTLEVVETLPVITSPLTVIGVVGDNFEYQITATNNVNSYSAIGLSVVGGLSLNSSTGLISGVPVNSGSFDVVLEATNSVGTVEQIVTFLIVLQDNGDGPTVEIVSINGESPDSNPGFGNDTTALDFVVEVTPDAGEVLESVFIQWTNPTATSALVDLLLVELTAETPIPTSGPITYTGSAPIGFYPTNREVGGGRIELEAVAIQRNTTNELSFGTSDEETITIEPLLEFLMPEAGVPQASIAAGGIYTVVRLSTNVFERITASISGVGTIDTGVDEDNTDNANGVFSFTTTDAISFPDTYTITVTAEDRLGNEVTITREFEIVEDTTSPVVVIASPTPGFRNDVFSPGSFTWIRLSSEYKRNDAGFITESAHTYGIDAVSRGQGYYPRNDGDARIHFSFFDEIGSYGGFAVVGGNNVENGRVVSMSEEITLTYPGLVLPFGESGIGILDNAIVDPGVDSRIEILADLFKANADLQSFRMFINGNDVTPGTGNVDPGSGPVFVPILTYPSTGSLSPGTYVVTAEVTDKDGEVGISRPLVFTIDSFEELEVNVTSDAADEVDQGDTVTYLAAVSQLNSIDTVEIFDSVTNESLGLASRVTIDGDVFYRFTRTYLEAGTYGVYARVTTLSGQQVGSNQLSVVVVPFNDASISITSPEADTELTYGQSLTFSAEAFATPGITSITWSVNNNPVQTTTSSSSSSYNFVTGPESLDLGNYTVTVSATDNFGNQVGSNESIVVSVIETDLRVRITSPTTSLTVFEGGQVEFSANATASVGVDSVEWFINGTSVETNNSAPFSFTQNFTSSGSYSVVAVATDSLGNTASSAAVTVSVEPSNPLLRDEDFVADIYNRLLGNSPTGDQLSEALLSLDGSLEARSQFIVDLLQSDAFQDTTDALLIFRTMIGKWPNSEEAEQALIDLYGDFDQSNTYTGAIVAFGNATETISFNTVNTRVRANVQGDGSAVTALRDPTLQIFGPNGNLIAFDDDSGFSLNPEIIFTVTTPGAHTFSVGGFGSSFGNYIMTVNSIGGTGEGVGASNPGALTTALVPEYNALFGSFESNVDTIGQLFRNKHLGSTITPLTQTRLLNASASEFSGNFISFVTEFALDNDESTLEGPGGLPLSSFFSYARPNSPEDDAALAILIARMLGVEPTDAAFASLEADSLLESVELVLTDERFYSQFDNSTTAGEVAQYMAGFGVFDISQIGVSDDPDGDGADNESEFNAGTDPTDPQSTPGWEPEAWVFFNWPYAYSMTQSRWYYFNVEDVQWRVNLSDSEWGTLSEATGWNYFNWPYSYSADEATWYWYNDDTQWVYDLLSGIWTQFGGLDD